MKKELTFAERLAAQAENAFAQASPAFFPYGQQQKQHDWEHVTSRGHRVDTRCQAVRFGR